jgi:hypothetical protein
MTITTLSGLQAGLQPPTYAMKSTVTSEAAGIFASSFYANGQPAAAAAPSPGINGAALTSYPGQIPFNNPASGNAYLAGLYATLVNGATNGFILIADRLWHNSGIVVTTTTEQAITSPTWPARDRNGSTNGDGVFVGIEVAQSVGNSTTISTTLNYTNSAGTAGRTGTLTTNAGALVNHCFMFFELQGGDTGIRSVEGITLGVSYVAGVVNLVAVRPLMFMPFYASPAPQDFYADAFTCGFPRLFDNTVPFALSCGNQSSWPDTWLTVQYAHG